MSTRRFAHSFHTIGKPPKGKPCDKLKYHYSGALRELVGIIELIAENDPDRFAFLNMPAMMEHCHRYKQPENKFGERWLRQCLSELRARSIISKRLQHLANRQIGMREGFYVVPHAAVCKEVGGLCVFQGYDPELCASWWAQQAPWAWPHLEISAPKSAPTSAPQNAGKNAPHSAPHSAGANAPHSAPLPSRHVDESENVNLENRSLTALAGVSVQTGGAVPSVHPFLNPPPRGAEKSEGGKEGDPFPFGVNENPAPMVEEMQRLKKILYDAEKFGELKGTSLNSTEEELYRTWLEKNSGEVDVLVLALREVLDNREEQNRGIEYKYKDKWATILKEAEEHGFIEDARAEEQKARNKKEWASLWEPIKPKGHPRTSEFAAWLKENQFATWQHVGKIKGNGNWWFDNEELPFAREVRALFEYWILETPQQEVTQ
jgi:hypothetical protein